MNNCSLIKKTPLYLKHCELNAKMGPFGEYLMPMQYEGIVKEHNATRTKTAIFDTCHMAEFKLSGDTACSDLERILTCPVSSLKIGGCRYGFICNKKGGVIDDQIIYRIAEKEFLMVLNSSTKGTDLKWIKSNISDATLFMDISDDTAKIDLQGPTSPIMMQKLLLGKSNLLELKYYSFMYDYYCDTKLLISRTGYTGEIGFEIYAPTNIAIKFWDECISLGAVPAGLGCRDTLRLEMGYPLYGHELNESINPVATGYERAIDTTKDFIGSNIINDPTKCKERLVGIELSGRQSARTNDAIETEQGETIGYITSGSYSPSLQKAIAMGYILSTKYVATKSVLINNGRKKLIGTIRQIPFYEDGTCRKAITKFI